MSRRFPFHRLFGVPAALVFAGLVAAPAAAQSKGPLTAPALPQASQSDTVVVPRDTTPPQPAAAQPILPTASPASPPKPGSPVVEQMVNRSRPLVVRKEAATRSKARRRHLARRYRVPPDLDRPALAGVELVAPLPAPGEPPHITTPTPAYPLETFAASITTPPPPIRCHHTRRDPDAPDPRLYREIPVECEPDNP